MPKAGLVLAMQEIRREISDVLAFVFKCWIFAGKMIDVERQEIQGTLSDTNTLTTLYLWK